MILVFFSVFSSCVLAEHLGLKLPKELKLDIDARNKVIKKTNKEIQERRLGNTEYSGEKYKNFYRKSKDIITSGKVEHDHLLLDDVFKCPEIDEGNKKYLKLFLDFKTDDIVEIAADFNLSSYGVLNVCFYKNKKRFSNYFLSASPFQKKFNLIFQLNQDSALFELIVASSKDTKYRNYGSLEYSFFVTDRS